jgi:hypothetical protein
MRGVRSASDSQSVPLSSIALEQTRFVIVHIVAIGALILVVVLVLVAGDERQPHVEFAPPPVSISMPPVPVASGGIAPEDPARRL